MSMRLEIAKKDMLRIKRLLNHRNQETRIYAKEIQSYREWVVKENIAMGIPDVSWVVSFIVRYAEVKRGDPDYRSLRFESSLSVAFNEGCKRRGSNIYMLAARAYESYQEQRSDAYWLDRGFDKREFCASSYFFQAGDIGIMQYALDLFDEDRDNFLAITKHCSG